MEIDRSGEWAARKWELVRLLSLSLAIMCFFRRLLTFHLLKLIRFLSYYSGRLSHMYAPIPKSLEDSVLDFMQ